MGHTHIRVSDTRLLYAPPTSGSQITRDTRLLYALPMSGSQVTRDTCLL